MKKLLLLFVLVLISPLSEIYAFKLESKIKKSGKEIVYKEISKRAEKKSSKTSTLKKDTLYINLGIGEGQKIVRTIERKKNAVIEVSNRVINADYKIHVGRKNIPQDKISLAKIMLDIQKSRPAPDSVNFTAADSILISFNSIIDLIPLIQDEKEMMFKIVELKHDLRLLEKKRNELDTASSDYSKYNKLIVNAKSLISKSRILINLEDIKKGEEIVVEITRITPKKVKTWNIIFSTGVIGHWDVSYGFSFIINSLSKSRKYYTSPNEKNLKF